MTPFHVGMSVVCIDDQWGPIGAQAEDGIPCPLSLNAIYTIKNIRFEFGARGNEVGKFLCATLHEVKHPSKGRGFALDRFRPAHENRMDELRQLLAPVPSKAKRVEA